MTLVMETDPSNAMSTLKQNQGAPLPSAALNSNDNGDVEICEENDATNFPGITSPYFDAMQSDTSKGEAGIGPKAMLETQTSNIFVTNTHKNVCTE